MIRQTGLSWQRKASAFLLFGASLVLAFAFIHTSLDQESYFYQHIDATRGGPSSVLSLHFCVDFLLYLFGGAALFLVPLLIAGAWSCVQHHKPAGHKNTLMGLSLLLLGTALLTQQCGVDFFVGRMPGGMVGYWASSGLMRYTDAFIAWLTTIVMLVSGMFLLISCAWVRPLLSSIKKIYSFASQYTWPKIACPSFFARSVSGEIPLDSLERLAQETIFNDPFWKSYHLDASQEVPPPEQSVAQKTAMPESESSDEPIFVVPGKQFFIVKEGIEISPARKKAAQERAHNLEKKLELFGIRGSVVSMTIGPVVTLFEYVPASDVKISKIVALEDDLALALEALSLRIIAPIPGKSVVGFEVDNQEREVVSFAALVSASTFVNSKALLPLIIGRDTIGHDVVVDLAVMPHLLVAGSTGAGKSVALNTMLMSLLCSRSPDEVRLILIDPKRLEFAAFADIAHLYFPIVTDVHRVPLILQWAVQLMEERYATLAQAGVRNIQEYHALHGMSLMPFTVIVIDELADLMMTVGRDVEMLIARLAQMARAAGIHLIIATQRPSVDVITGLIKVNFPSRIAFKVTSKVDSRTILDTVGAEKLLGKGDMLFLNHRGMIVRVHGAYVHDEEIARVVTHIQQQRPVDYREHELVMSAKADVADTAESDPLLTEVLLFVATQEHISISLLQRRFRIGFNRSARLIDTLEAQGKITPADGSKMRKVVH